jgi:hypothetical protein
VPIRLKQAHQEKEYDTQAEEREKMCLRKRLIFSSSSSSSSFSCLRLSASSLFVVSSFSSSCEYVSSLLVSDGNDSMAKSQNA